MFDVDDSNESIAAIHAFAIKENLAIRAGFSRVYSRSELSI